MSNTKQNAADKQTDDTPTRSYIYSYQHRYKHLDEHTHQYSDKHQHADQYAFKHRH